VLAYDQENPAGSSRIKLEPGGYRFPSRQLVPPEILPQQGPLPQQGAYTLMVQALYFQDEQIGFMLLDGNQREGDVYDTLRAQISSALQGAFLVQRVQERSAELVRQQYILDTFMENIPDRIYFKDLKSRITRGNKAFATWVGFDDPAAGIGQTDFDFFSEDLARTKYEQEQEIIRTGQPILNLEEPDGIDRWALTTKMPLRDESDAIIGTFGISHDITEMKQAQAELVRQERLSALGQLTATVAHEIRNPLGTVRTCVFSIGDAIERDEAERVLRALQLAERNIVRCDTIISELLDYTRVLVLQPSPTHIDAWLSGVLDEQIFPEDIACVRELNASVEVSADTEHLHRAIIKVMDNAIDAMREVEPAEKGHRLTVSTCVAKDRVEIRVNDTGSGIPDEIRDRVFDPLFSTKSFGIGLGLPIVKGIMEQHSGGVEISSQRDVGTTVVLWLPISDR
jgi:PAS domain S-box-containing protein